MKKRSFAIRDRFITVVVLAIFGGRGIGSSVSIAARRTDPSPDSKPMMSDASGGATSLSGSGAMPDGIHTLRDACAEVMGDPEVRKKYPDGLTSVQIREEIEIKHPGGFPFATWLDVHDEMTAIYGKAERRG